MASQSTILVVDDDAGIRVLLQRLLAAQGYAVVAAQDGTEALNLIAEARPDLLLVDAVVPNVDGLTLCRRLREHGGTRPLPIILMTATAETEALWNGFGADAVLHKPFNRGALLSWIRCLVRARQADEDCDRAEALLIAVAAAVETRSMSCKEHPWRVAACSTQLAAAARVGDDAAAIIRKAALLHDVGKIGVPEAILGKPGSLTRDEFEQVKQHVILGADLCRWLRDGAEIGAVVRSHHERWDGTGYPDGLAGENIPLGARILAVADALDALTTDRPYRRALSMSEAFEVLWFGAAGQWDPRLIECLDRVVPKDFVADDSNRLTDIP